MGNAWWAENFSVGRSSLQKMISDGSGLLALSGVGSSQLKKFLSDGFGWEDPSGSAASILKKLISDGSGSQIDNGIAASIMKQLVSDGLGDIGVLSGIGSSSFLKMISNGSGLQLDSGIGASSLKKLISDGSGSQSVPLAFDSVQAGATGYSFTRTWNHTPIAAKVTMVVIVAIAQTSIASVTCGGTSMSKVAGNGSVGDLSFWKLDDVTGGVAQAIVVNTPSSGSQSGITPMSIAYTGVNSVATAGLTGNAANTSLTAAVSIGTAKRILQAFGVFNGGASGASVGSPSGGTNRYNGSQGQYSGLCVSDAAVTTTFTGTGTPSFYSGWNTQALLLS